MPCPECSHYSGTRSKLGEPPMRAESPRAVNWGADRRERTGTRSGTMPLSEHEQKMLDEMERQLFADDPRLAKAFAPKTPPRRNGRRIIIGLGPWWWASECWCSRSPPCRLARRDRLHRHAGRRGLRGHRALLAGGGRRWRRGHGPCAGGDSAFMRKMEERWEKRAGTTPASDPPHLPLPLRPNPGTESRDPGPQEPGLVMCAAWGTGRRASASALPVPVPVPCQCQCQCLRATGRSPRRSPPPGAPRRSAMTRIP